MAAKPDLEDGWLRYAHELDAALAVADFSKGARIVLREVFAQIYGPARLPAATLSVTEIGRRVGMDRRNVSTTIGLLVKDQVLLLQTNGSFKFNKNYTQWLYKGDPRRPRLSSVEVAYASSAVTTALSYKHSKEEKSAEKMSSDEMTSDPILSSNEMTSDPQMSSNQMTNVIQPDDTPYNPLLRKLKKGEGETPPSFSQEALPVLSSGFNGMPAGDNPLVLSEAEVTEVHAVAALADSNAFFPMAELGLAIQRDPKPVAGMAVSWWRPALERLRESPRDKRTWTYLLGILRGFKATGGPPNGPGSKPLGGPAERPEPPIEYLRATRIRQPRRRDYPDLKPRDPKGQ